MINISKIKHSSFLRHFLRILKFSPRFTRLTSCFSKKCLPITERFYSPTRWWSWWHVLRHTTHIEIHIHWHSSFYFECCILFCTWNWQTEYQCSTEQKKESEPRWKGWVAILVLEKMKIYLSGELLPWGKSRHNYYYVRWVMQYWGITISSPSAGTRCDWLSCVDFTRVVIWFIKTTWRKQKSVWFT